MPCGILELTLQKIRKEGNCGLRMSGAEPLFDFSRRDADVSAGLRNVPHHHGACAQHAAAADADSIAYDCSGPDPCFLTDMYGSRNSGTHGDVRKVFNAIVVFHDAAGVDDAVPSNAGARIDDGVRHDYGALANAGVDL